MSDTEIQLRPVFEDARDTADVTTLLLGSSDPLGCEPAPAAKLIHTDGTKQTRQPAYYVAYQIHTPDVGAMQRVLEAVAKQPNAAVCNGRFPGLPVFELDALTEATEGRLREARGSAGFIIAPKARIETLTAAHPDLRFVARTKEATLPTAWLALDRDHYPHTPERFSSMSNAEWLGMLAQFIPGVDTAPRLETPSSSARILDKHGNPTAPGRGHVWVKMKGLDHKGLSRARNTTRDSLIAAGQAWTSPAASGRPVVHIPVDLATWTSCTMIYSGKPELEPGSTLRVAEARIEAVNASGPPAELTCARGPSQAALLLAQQLLRPGVRVSISGTGARTQLDCYDLEPADEVELEDGGTATLADVHAQLLAQRAGGAERPKVRMQSPLRPESRSLAAFATLARDGDLMVSDSGLPGEAHWLGNDPAADFRTVAETDGAPLLSTVPPSRFQVLRAHEFAVIQSASWLVKGVVPRGQLVVLFGPSGSGKSFFALDMAGAIACGTEWRGHRVTQTKVVIIAAEGASGVRKRLLAYAREQSADIEQLQIGIIADTPNLLAGDELAVIKAIEQSGGAGLIIIDTLAQTTPGGDENTSTDMGMALSACRRIHAATGATVMLVHHAGKDAAKGARGWSGLRAAADAEISIDRKGDERWADVTKQKDAEDGLRFGFQLRSVVLGADEDGDPVTSCVVDYVDAPPPPAVKLNGKYQPVVYRTIENLLLLDDEGSLPEDTVIRQAVEQMPLLDDGKDRRRDNVLRALKDLEVRGLIYRGQGCITVNPTVPQQPHSG